MSKHQIQRDGLYLYVKATGTAGIPVGFGRIKEEVGDVLCLTPQEAEAFAGWLRLYAEEARATAAPPGVTPSAKTPCSHPHDMQRAVITDVPGAPPNTRTEPAWCRLCGSLFAEGPFGIGWGWSRPLAGGKGNTTLGDLLRESAVNDATKEGDA